MVNCINWKKDTRKLLTVSQIQSYAHFQASPKLIAISDVAALVNGPIEFFTEECKIESPYFLYDMERNRSYESYQALQSDAAASDKVIAYLGVEQLPAELPVDASMMFSSKLEEYVPAIMAAAWAVRT